ncbi:uncharacterized protein LOC144627311 isoform X3 [Crassostrea virginica]
MGWEFARVVCYTMCSFLPNTVLLGWSFFSPYWINDKSNNGTTECFRGVLFNVGCVDEDKRLGDAVLGLLIAYFASIVLGLMAYLRCYQHWCNEEVSLASLHAKLLTALIATMRKAWRFTSALLLVSTHLFKPVLCPV